MKDKRLSFGIFLLSIGVLWLLFNFDILDGSIFKALFTLWPLLLVMVGINIIFRNNEIVKSVGWLAFLAVIIIYGYFNQGKVEVRVQGEGNTISVEKMVETKNGDVRLDLGGAGLKMGAQDSKLLDAYVTDPYVKNTIQYRNGNETADIRFSKESTKIAGFNHMNQEFILNLNKDILWNLNLNVGAVNGTLDMSELKVTKLDMDAGAVNLELIFGSNMKLTDVKIDSGASQYEVIVPDGTGVRAKIDGGLNKTNFDELQWAKRGGYYYSPNYDQAENKIHFDIDMGVGKFEIKPNRS